MMQTSLGVMGANLWISRCLSFLTSNIFSLSLAFLCDSVNFSFNFFSSPLLNLQIFQHFFSFFRSILELDLFLRQHDLHAGDRLRSFVDFIDSDLEVRLLDIKLFVFD